MKKRNFCIPVLMYHHVNKKGDFINVRPELFDSHMKYLREHRFTALHADELLSILNGQNPPEKPVMVTFDDGWLDNWVFAYPVLRKYGMKAVIFAITSLLPENGKRQRSDEGNAPALPLHGDCKKMTDEGRSSDVIFSWEEASEMERSGLIDIQSHTNTHRRWDKLYPDRNERTSVLHQELVTSKKIIEKKLNKECNALCWPWGIYDKDYIEAAKSAGYKVLFTTEKGTNTGASDILSIRRLPIGNISSFSLRKKLFIHSKDWLSKAYLRIF